MSRRTPVAIASAAVTALLATGLATGLAACGHSAPTTLHGLLATPPVAPYPTYAGPPIRVDAVRLPAALDRIELLEETAPGRFRVRESDRWAAPPSRLALQALIEDLTLRLPPGAVIAGGGGGPRVSVSVEVLSFTQGPQRAALSAVWTRSCRTDEASQRTSLRLEAPASADTPQMLSHLLAQLADRMAEQLSIGAGPACS